MTKLLIPRSTVPVTLVCGPPCSGKSTYVGERAQSTDLVIDFDAILGAIAPLTGAHARQAREAFIPYVCEARDAMLSRLARPSGITKAWVISYGATRGDRARFGTRDVVILDVHLEECKRRARVDDRPAGTDEQIDKWWQTYEPVAQSRSW